MKHKMKFTNKQNELFYDIFKRSFITEKTSHYELNLNTITFMTEKWCSKTIIKRALECMLDSKVLEVRILNTAEKTQRKNTKKGVMNGQRPSEKKVMVRLESIDKLKEVLL